MGGSHLSPLGIAENRKVDRTGQVILCRALGPALNHSFTSWGRGRAPRTQRTVRSGDWYRELTIPGTNPTPLFAAAVFPLPARGLASGRRRCIQCLQA